MWEMNGIWNKTINTVQSTLDQCQYPALAARKNGMETKSGVQGKNMTYMDGNVADSFHYQEALLH